MSELIHEAVREKQPPLEIKPEGKKEIEQGEIMSTVPLWDAVLERVVNNPKRGVDIFALSRYDVKDIGPVIIRAGVIQNNNQTQTLQAAVIICDLDYYSSEGLVINSHNSDPDEMSNDFSAEPYIGKKNSNGKLDLGNEFPLISEVSGNIQEHIELVKHVSFSVHRENGKSFKT